MSEIAKFEELVQDEKKTLYSGKFQNGLLNFEEHIWDKMYKRVLVDVIVSHQFGLNPKQELSLN